MTIVSEITDRYNKLTSKQTGLSGELRQVRAELERKRHELGIAVLNGKAHAQLAAAVAKLEERERVLSAAVASTEYTIDETLNERAATIREIDRKEHAAIIKRLSGEGVSLIRDLYALRDRVEAAGNDVIRARQLSRKHGDIFPTATIDAEMALISLSVKMLYSLTRMSELTCKDLLDRAGVKRRF